MSSWFSQNLIYGYKTTHEEFDKITDGLDGSEYDRLMAENNSDGWGWIVDDGYAIYGKIILTAEDAGNDYLFAAESGVVEVQLPSMAEAREIGQKIHDVLAYNIIIPEEIQFYITGQYR